MATAHRVAGPPEQLSAALREVLMDAEVGDPADAERLACLLLAREHFADAVGAPPGGALEWLPAPFEALSVPETVRPSLPVGRSTLDDAVTIPGSIGSGYEHAVDIEARGARGQFFTPPVVADRLVEWALDGTGCEDGLPRVLDPAAGSGTFLLAAHQRLAELAPDRSPSERLERLVGVDVDGAALHLAGLRLAAAAEMPEPERLALHRYSFFDCEPVDGEWADDTSLVIDPVDAIVGNPPFVRAEHLEPDMAHYRRHLGAFGPAGEAPLRDGPAALDRRSDAYVYFVTHATRFLRPGGRLALVLPTKWLMSAYGEGLRRFLRQQYRVEAVIGVGAHTFGDALVDTCLLLAERDTAADGAASMRFLRFGERSNLDGLPDLDAGASVPTAEVVEQPQTALTASESLARYLEAPIELLSMLDGPPFVRLDEVARVARGTMTGANRFFFIDDTDIDRFGIEPRFRRPAVKSLRSIDQPRFEPTAVDRALLDVHPVVDQVRHTLDSDVELEPAVRAALAADGYEGLLAYIQHAEAVGWHEGRTCQSRPVWFDLGPLRAPAAFVPKLLRERVFVVRNGADAVPSNAIDGVWPDEVVDAGALLAVLNASVGRAAMEVTGRDEAGLLQLMTYETASLPTLDVRELEPALLATLARAGAAYADDPTAGTLAALDSAVHRAFDLPLPPEAIRDAATSIRRRRVDGIEPAASAD